MKSHWSENLFVEKLLPRIPSPLPSLPPSPLSMRVFYVQSVYYAQNLADQSLETDRKISIEVSDLSIVNRLLEISSNFI